MKTPQRIWPTLLLVLIGFYTLTAQPESRTVGFTVATETPLWIIKMYSPDADPGEVLRLYEAYYKEHVFIKNQHTQYLKRWISGLSKAVVPDSVHDQIYLDRYKKAQQQRSVANWTPLGPFDWDHTAAARSYAPGSAHVYTVEQSISNPDIVYAGTANAGVWKSTDRGLNWTAKTNDLLTGSVTAIEIDPTNPDILYAELLANIYKSSNGGSSWQGTGNPAFMALTFSTHDIRCVPDQPLTVFSATSNGLYKTTDGGGTWTSVLSGHVLEIEFHPTRTDTMYAVRVNGSKTEFFRSYNAGSSFTQITNGWPNPNIGNGEHQERTEIAVTLDAPDKVYALATGSANGGSGLYGVYISGDLGSSWTFQCCGDGPGGPPSPTNFNLMGWDDGGQDNGGQYYYDLAFGVSPYDKDSMWVCGVNLWVSSNEGASFVCPAKWSHPHKPNYVHADIHDLNYMAHTGEIWVAGDGGIFYSDDSGASFQRRNVGISGSDFWGFGIGHWYGNVMIGGAYHNGTLMKEEDTYLNGWICTDGGDGVGGFVNPGLDRQAYSNYNIKQLHSNRTIAPSTRAFQYQPNSTYITGMSSDLLFHPHYYGTWYSGSGTKLYLTRDNGFTFEEIYNFGVNVAAMDLCMADPRVIYACTFPDWWGIKRIYRTMDGGSTWTEVTPPAAVLNNADQWIPYDIAVDPQDPMKVWIVRTSMYNGYPNINGHQVYTSDNGGAGWTNISTSYLNGQYPNAIMHQRGTNGGIYIGTRTSVYYRNATMPDWELYATGLPARTHSIKLLPWYRHGMIRTATDRSVWESPFYEPSDPIAIPAVQKQYLFCERDTAYFTDLSVVNESGVSWSWSFPGGTPSASSLRNPKVVYEKPGLYDVSLIVADIHGTDTAEIAEMIVADNRCSIDTTPGGAMDIIAHPGHLRIEDLNLTTQTLTVTAWIKPDGIQSEYSGIWMNDGVAAGFNFRESNNTLAYHWPGGAWWWDSNLTVPAGEWSHIALVVQPGSVKLFVNGVSATHATNVEQVTLNDIRVGSYQDWNGRTFKGEMDEVAVWNRALSEVEIRLSRHLVKEPADPTLIHYYQFDEVESGDVIDKIGGYDGVLTGTATIIPSDAPVGAGTSQILLVQHGGNASFANGGDLDIGFGNTHPDGIVVVSHLHVPPDTLPADRTAQGEYWIVNNYGNTVSFSGLDSLGFLDAGSVSHVMAENFGFNFYTRSANAYGPVWTQLQQDSIVPHAGLSAEISGYNVFSLRSLGQLLIMRDTVWTGTADVMIASAGLTNPLVSGGESISLLLNSVNQGVQLPVISASSINTLGIPEAGLLTYLTDSSAIVYFNGTQWMQLDHQSVLQYSSNAPPEMFGTLSMSGSAAQASTLLQLSNGFISLPAFTSTDLLDVAFLAPGMLVFDLTASVVKYFDGNAWKALTSSATNIPVSVTPAQPVAGMAINQIQKYPSAVLDMNPLGGKAFQLPTVNPQYIYNPAAGLICFNPRTNKLMLFDGLRWNVFY